MNKLIAIACASAFIAGCAKPESENSFNAVVTFPVNQVCHNYISGVQNENGKFEMEYKPFTVKLDAFPQVVGFIELKSNSLINVELQNEAVKIMDRCFARAKTTINISTPESWIKAGKAIQFNEVNDVPIHSLVLNGSQLDIYYNWSDKSK